VRVVEPELPPWVNEPATIQTLLDRYNVEAKVTGRLAGTTLFLVASRDRFGKCEACSWLQRFFQINQFVCFRSLIPIPHTSTFDTFIFHVSKEEVEDRQDWKLFLATWIQL
jgi:hypothetical protein